MTEVPSESGAPTRPGTLCGVSVGPGDPELMTLKAVRVIESCPVVAAPHARRGADVALEIARSAVDLSGKRILELPFSMSRDEREREAGRRASVELLTDELAAGHDVALLNLGDAGIYSTFGYVRDAVARAGYRVETVPGVPSFCAVAARLGRSLTEGSADPLHIIPAVGEGFADDLRLPGSLVVMKAGRSLGEVKRALAEAGRLEEASLVSDCGLPDERVADALDEAPDDAAGYFTTLVVARR